MEQYRFGPMQPRYFQGLREGCVQHLAEYYSGAWRGTVLRMGCNGLAGFYAVLAARQYVHALPGIAHMGYGERDAVVRHSFANRWAFGPLPRQ